jgi:hypothetical protein
MARAGGRSASDTDRRRPPTFGAASPRYQLAATVAQFADLLRLQPVGNPSSLPLVSAQANRLSEMGSLAADPNVAEFASLVARNVGAFNRTPAQFRSNR